MFFSFFSFVFNFGVSIPVFLVFTTNPVLHAIWALSNDHPLVPPTSHPSALQSSHIDFQSP